MTNFFQIVINKVIGLFDKSWNYSQKVYSLEGEDVILMNHFGDKKDGFYVDVGAHHPFRFSNTYMFYKKGWNGINIDATPGSMGLFNKYRQRDINIETAVSNGNTNIDYFIFDEPALNSFSLKLSNDRNRNTKYKIRKTISLRPRKLCQILDKWLPEGKEIDFLSIDVEGYEYEVVISNNWNKYKPTFLLIEFLKNDFSNITSNKIYKFLKNLNYSIIGITGRTVLFEKRDDKRNTGKKNNYTSIILDAVKV